MSRYCCLAGARVAAKNRWVEAAVGNSRDDTERIPASPAATPCKLVYCGTRKLAALRPRGRSQTGPTGPRASGSTGSQAAIYQRARAVGLLRAVCGTWANLVVEMDEFHV